MVNGWTLAKFGSAIVTISTVSPKVFGIFNMIPMM